MGYMRKLTVLLLGIIITLNLPFTSADETSEETHYINLYMFGRGGGHSPSSEPLGNLTAKLPSAPADEYQVFYPDPLYLNISIIGDVHFSIWAICNQPRNISFLLLFNIIKPESGYGHGPATESKMVYNNPVEFNAVVTEEDIEEYELKNFSTGDRIGIGSSVAIDILNPKTSDEKASVDVEIIDAFGVYDISDYDVLITAPSGKNIVYIDIEENISNSEGKIDLQTTWDKSKGESGNHSVRVTVLDNNNNQWERVEYLEIDYSKIDIQDGDSSESENSIISFPNLVFLLGMEILTVILIYFFLSRRRKIKKI
jgi:hypothetical protein